MKPSIPKGTRDFSPEEMRKRNHIFGVIRNVFESYGYQPLETPSMENLSTLMGKYGEEGDKLIFKILNSGNFLEELANTQLSTHNSQQLASHIAEKALRYDLTVPFARYVVLNQHTIVFPFKRYQIQPVWRADRPQKGRYREFYQCDVDVIGSTSLLNEVELIQIIDDVFSTMKIPVTIKLNNRKILSALAETWQVNDVTDITVALDKLDKTGIEKVKQELSEKGLSNENINSFEQLIGKKDLTQIIESLENLFTNSRTGKTGLDETRSLLSLISNFKFQISNYSLDISLARGLNYYTGTIIEVKANTGSLTSSLCGGGRYDDLTGIFGLPNVSGVGISFGADRIYDVMEELNLFPEAIAASSKVIFFNMGEQEVKHCLTIAAQLRAKGISCEVYPDPVKLKKQFDYAGKKGIEYAVIIGSDEIQKGEMNVKNLKTGEQVKIKNENLTNHIK